MAGLRFGLRTRTRTPHDHHIHVALKHVCSCQNGGAVIWQQLRSMGNRWKKPKRRVEPLSNTPNSLATLFNERVVSNDMDLTEIWDKVTEKRTKALERIDDEIDSTTRFEEKSTETGSLLLDKKSTELTRDEINRYYPLEKGFLHEAFREFYRFTAADGQQEIPTKGCKGLYDDVEMTGVLSVLHRQCMQSLKEMLTDEDPLKIWLRGKAGSGKSISLASLVEWARQNSWLVLYLPSATLLLTDYFFNKEEGRVTYDTIIAAKDILRSVYSIYGGDQGVLSTLPIAQPGPNGRDFGETLEQLCQTGLSTNNPAMACDAVVGLLNEFLRGDHGVEKLVAIDDYNALYWQTKYYNWRTDHHKIMIPPSDVTLAKAFRVMDDDTELKCHIVAAPTFATGIPHYVHVTHAPSVHHFDIPPFTEDEIYCSLCHFWKRGLIRPVDVEVARRLYFVTRGNMHEIKQSTALL